MNGAPPSDPLVIEGATVLLCDRAERVSIRIESGLIAGLDVPRDGARVVDAHGLIVAPALVDIHGDAFERQVMPRPGVFVPLDAALLETDRQLAGNGIATAYHALTLSWEPGLRGVDRGAQILDGLAALAPRLAAENRVQLRWETFCFEAIPLIERALSGPLTPSIAFNDHTTMALLHPEIALQDRPFDLVPDYPVCDFDGPRFEKAVEGRARRSGVTTAEFTQMMRERWAMRDRVADAIAKVARAGRSTGAPMLSHDDSQIETRDFFRGHGARISEFPMNPATAQAARDAGDWIVFGAPNALRGGSHIGSPGAADMVARGLCDILASDYYYPAMLGALARMLADGVAPLPTLWNLVAGNPARASGLTDRGEISPGKRADLVILDWPEGRAPAPLATLRAGRAVFAARSFGT